MGHEFPGGPKVRMLAGQLKFYGEVRQGDTGTSSALPAHHTHEEAQWGPGVGEKSP